MKLSIILPTRNEEVLIKNTLEDIVSFLEKRKVSEYEVLVIINGTEDKTEDIASGFAARNRKIKILRSKPGYGKPLRVGLKESKGDYIIIFNVDFYDLRMIDLVNIDLYGKDFIIGSKMTHWSEDKRSVLRKVISILFNLYLKLAFGFKGSDTHGIKIMRRIVADKILPECKTDSGIFDTEFVLRSQYAGFKFADFPVKVEEKRPPRFTQRLLQTPIDIFNLSKTLKDIKNNV
jgi:glycosyltransferase involved in cell wall biosynthesis